MKQHRFKLLMLVLMLMFVVQVAAASAQSLDVSNLVTQLFDGVNTWITSLGGILVIGPAIGLAVIIIGLIVISIQKGLKMAKGGN